MNYLCLKSLVRFSNLETLYFAARALATLGKLPEEVRNSEYAKNFTENYNLLVTAVEKQRTNPYTVELTEVRKQMFNVFNSIRQIITANVYNPETQISDLAKTAKEIVDKYGILKGNNLFKKIEKIKRQLNEFNQLGKPALKTLGIDILLSIVANLLDKHESVYDARGSYSQATKGYKPGARDALNKAWSDFADYVNAYNAYIAPESCNEFALIIDELYDKSKGLNKTSTTEVSTDTEVKTEVTNS